MRLCLVYESLCNALFVFSTVIFIFIKSNTQNETPENDTPAINPGEEDPLLPKVGNGNIKFAHCLILKKIRKQ